MNFTNKLKYIYGLLLQDYADHNFIIKLATQEISKASIYKLLDTYTKNDVDFLHNNIRDLFGSTLVIDGTDVRFDSADTLLTGATPNLDEAFKQRMVNNIDLIMDSIRELSEIDALDQTKINAYLDDHYKKSINTDFFKLFEKVDAATISQLELLKKDESNDSMMQDIITDFYPMFIEQKKQELITNTISVKELIQFKAD